MEVASKKSELGVVILQSGDLGPLGGGRVQHEQINILAIGGVADKHALHAQYPPNVDVVVRQVRGQLRKAAFKPAWPRSLGPCTALQN